MGLLLLVCPAANAQFLYITNNGTITITGYVGTNSAVAIPRTINGLRVTSIGTNAFSGISNVSSITISNGLLNLDQGHFIIAHS